MSNPEVTRLIQELSSILEQNRQKRNVMDSMLQGLKQGREMAQAQKAPPAPDSPETGYGGDRSVSPYSYKNSPSPSAKSLSPSTSREGRLGIASKYAETQGREAELLGTNPYRAGHRATQEELATTAPITRSDGQYDETGYLRHTNKRPELVRMHEDPSAREMELLNSNPYRGAESANPTDMAIQQELAKRNAQRSGQGSPLGGAGMPPPTSNGLDPSIVDSVSRSGGPIAPMGNPMVNTGGPQQPGPAAAMPNAPPAGWSAEDYNLLNALSQRYPGG